MKRLRNFVAVGITAALAVLAFASAASANPTPEFEQSSESPYSNLAMNDCVYAVFSGDSFTIGNKTIPVSNQITLQGGYTGAGAKANSTAPQTAKGSQNRRSRSRGAWPGSPPHSGGRNPFRNGSTN